MPSIKENNELFLEAKLSALAKIKQLTTINGIYNPRALSRAGTYALSNKPTIVTNVAITTTNAGILI